MATMTSFKQTCPSCEARVLVKNHAMIGRKIECPRCKYPFVVEKPQEDTSAEDGEGAPSDAAPAVATAENKPAAAAKGGKAAKGAAKPAPDTAVTAQAPATGAAVADTKPEGAKDETATADGAKPAKKKKKLKLRLPQFSKMSKRLKIGIALGAVAVIALIVGLVLMLSGGDGPKASSSKIAGKSSSLPVVGSQSNKSSGPGSVVAAPSSSPTSIKSGPSSPPPKGSGSSSAVASKGSASNLVKEFTSASDLASWVPADADTVISTQDFARKFDESAFLGGIIFKTTGGLVRSWVEERIGVKLAEVRRVIVAQGGETDHRWMLTFMRLEQGITPDDYLAAISRSTPTKTSVGKLTYYVIEPNPLVEGLGNIAGGIAVHPAAVQPRGVFIADDNKTVVIGDQARLVKLLEEGKEKDGAYVSLPSSLRHLIDRVERKQTPLVTAVSARPDSELFDRIDILLNTDRNRRTEKGYLTDLFFPDNPKEAGLMHMGIALQKLAISPDGNTVQFTIAMEYENPEKAKAAYVTFVKFHQRSIAIKVWALTGLQIEEPVLPKFEAPSDASSAGPKIKPPPKSSESPKFTPPKSTIAVYQSDTAVVLSVDLNWPVGPADQVPFANLAMTGFVRAACLHTKGKLDMMGNRDALGELSQAVTAYVAERKKGPAGEQKFPRGALKRELNEERRKDLGGAPWPVKERLSWLVELLPYLPRNEFGSSLKTSEQGKKIWNARHTLGPHDEPIASAGQFLIPSFLTHREADEPAWWIAKVGRFPLGATHFVGVAGIGLNIASADITKPAFAKQAGIFGYDRETDFSQIKGGLDRTILMIEIPVELPADVRDPDYGPVYPTPWLVGGGTVRGVPEKDSLAEFLSTKRDGKVGTHVIMADGTVRFLAKGAITDAQFRSLCTLDGDKPTLEELDQIAPRVNTAPPAPPKVEGSASSEPPQGSGSGSASSSGSGSKSSSSASSPPSSKGSVSAGSKESSGSGSASSKGSGSGSK